MAEQLESLKAELAKKDRTIRILKAEIENLKRNLSQKSDDKLLNRIKFLENELKIKEKTIADLKTIFPKGGDNQQLQTKIIVLQSKLRKSNQQIEELNIKLKEYELKNKRLEEQLKNKDFNENLTQEIENYKRKIAQLKARISELEQTASKVKILEQQVLSLQKELTKKSKPKPGGDFGDFMATDAGEIKKLKKIIQEKNERINELEEQLASAGSGGGPVMGFLAQNQAKRRIKELEAQIAMLKKSEAEMKRRYDEAMRKIAARDEFAGY
ncbi:MAG: hypothetical protein ACTSRZ_06750 [Promethearchaeota archaeon]